MSNLIKIVSTHVKVVKEAVPGQPADPGTAGTPSKAPTAYRPAFCQREKVGSHEQITYTCTMIPIPGTGGATGSGGGSIPDPGAPVFPLPGGGYGYAMCGIKHTGVWVDDYETVCYPEHLATPFVPGTVARPARPATPTIPEQHVIIEDRHIGWSGSGISVTHFGATDNVKLTFRFRGVHAVVGLNDADEGSAYHEIDYAFRVSTSEWRVMEKGVLISTVGGDYTDHDPAFAIIRFNGQVSYHRWVSGAWSRVYVSLVRSVAPIFTDASMYMGGDLIG